MQPFFKFNDKGRINSNFVSIVSSQSNLNCYTLVQPRSKNKFSQEQEQHTHILRYCQTFPDLCMLSEISTSFLNSRTRTLEFDKIYIFYICFLNLVTSIYLANCLKTWRIANLKNMAYC